MVSEADKLRRMVDNLVKSGEMKPETVEIARKISEQQKAALELRKKDYGSPGKR